MRLSYIVVAVAVVVGAAFASASAPAFAEDGPAWTPIFKGVDVATRKVDSPLQQIFVARVDLTAEGVEFATTPPNKDFKADERETWRQTTPEFLTDSGVALAVNGNFYTPFDRETILNPGDANLRGLAVCDGFVESRPEDGFPSFAVKKSGDVEIRQFAVDENLDDVSVAVSGPAIVLKEGEVVPIADKAVHPRTAVGFSADKRFVYFVVIDGRRPEYSVGATLEEVGAALKYFGAAEGLNLDGGGSTTMVVRGENGEPKVLNRPINPIVESGLRQNGNAIGVKALAL